MSGTVARTRIGTARRRRADTALRDRLGAEALATARRFDEATLLEAHAALFDRLA